MEIKFSDLKTGMRVTIKEGSSRTNGAIYIQDGEIYFLSSNESYDGCGPTDVKTYQLGYRYGYSLVNKPSRTIELIHTVCKDEYFEALGNVAVYEYAESKVKTAEEMYEVGEVVRVIANRHGHGWAIGSYVRIKSFTKSDDQEMRAEAGCESWWIKTSEIEKV